jgi:hypothetical protein
MKANWKLLVERVGPERAHRIADYSRNLFIFPNQLLISSRHTIRTFYPLAPDYMDIDAWANLPRGESPELRQRRFENFISFLGPAGFGTPDDVYVLEGCQRGFAALARTVVVRHIPRHGPRALEPGRIADARLPATLARIDAGAAWPHRLLRPARAGCSG